MPGGCTLSAHGAGKLIVKTDGQTKAEKDTYTKLCSCSNSMSIGRQTNGINPTINVITSTLEMHEPLCDM
jgi:hypothetical protein